MGNGNLHVDEPKPKFEPYDLYKKRVKQATKPIRSIIIRLKKTLILINNNI